MPSCFRRLGIGLRAGAGVGEMRATPGASPPRSPRTGSLTDHAIEAGFADRAAVSPARARSTSRRGLKPRRTPTRRLCPSPFSSRAAGRRARRAWPRSAPSDPTCRSSHRRVPPTQTVGSLDEPSRRRSTTSGSLGDLNIHDSMLEPATRGDRAPSDGDRARARGPTRTSVRAADLRSLVQSTPIGSARPTRGAPERGERSVFGPAVVPAGAVTPAQLFGWQAALVALLLRPQRRQTK